ncbi:GNAT family N-acetyltransferase [Flavobacteriaceae bacterium M23B6Z8]
MLSKPALHKVSIEELEVLRQLSIQTFSEKFSEDNTSEDLTNYLIKAFNREQLEKELRNSKSFFYFLKLKDRIQGYLKLNKGDAQNELKDQNCVELERIYVLKEYQRKGLGHFLMNFAIEWAVKQEVSFIWLGVWEKNEAAIRFYQKYNFKKFGSHEFILGNDKQTDLLMKRSLID